MPPRQYMDLVMSRERLGSADGGGVQDGQAPARWPRMQTRKLLSALILALWAGPCVFLALYPDSGVQAFFGSLGAIYGLAFAGIVGNWFWARWFAVGVGWWGAFAGSSLMLSSGIGWFLILFTLTHLGVVGLLHNAEVAAAYEGRPDWRAKWNLDDRGAARVGGLVTNLGTLLPFAAFYAFFLRGMAVEGVLAMGVAAAGLAAIVRMRTWGLFAIAASGALLFASAAEGGGDGARLVGVLLALTTLRFAPDVVRWFRRD